MAASSSNLPTKVSLLPDVESNNSLDFLFSDEKVNNIKFAIFYSRNGLPMGGERTILRLQMNHVKGPACFSMVKKMAGEVLKGPESAFVDIGIEMPIPRQTPPILQTLLDTNMVNLSPNFRDNIGRFDC